MNFRILLSNSPSKFLTEATQVLKREGQEITKELPSGTVVKYIRGKNIDAHGFGEKYNLYKEVTKPDGFRTVTNANVIRDNVYVNEIFLIEPNGWCPDYVMYYDKYFYIPEPGISNEFRIQPPNGLDRRSQYLKDLLLKKIEPFNEASYKRSQKSWEEHCKKCYEADPKRFREYQQYSKKAQGEYNYQRSRNEGANSSQNSRYSGSCTSSTGKITKEQFINFMMEKVSRLKSKELIDTRMLKDSEIRNLARLFGINEAVVRNLDKGTKRNLILKYHPDTNGGDEISAKIFQIVNRLQAA